MRWLVVLLAFLAAALVPAACGSGNDVATRASETETTPGGLIYTSKGDLYAISLAGSRVLRLTHTRKTERNPAVSPDGHRIGYSTGGAVWLMNLDGTGRRELVARPPGRLSWADDPAWSPDGRTIFIDQGGDTDEGLCGSIYQVRADGRALRPFARHPGGVDYSHPAVSRRGTRIAFNSAECDPTMFPDAEIKVVDRSGKRTDDLRKLPPPVSSYWRPTWSPDGQQIAFESELTDCDICFARIYVANRDGSHLRRVTPKGLFGSSPAWSPDGQWIAFVGERGYSLQDLFIIHPDGTGLRRLTRTAGNDHPDSPAWLPRLPGA